MLKRVMSRTNVSLIYDSLERCLRGENLTPLERYIMANEMITAGSGNKNIQSVLSHLPDYDERLVNYQLDLIRFMNMSWAPKLSTKTV